MNGEEKLNTRFAHKGHKVTVFNRDKSKAERLRSANSSITLGVANQPSDIGSNCDKALICVKDYEAVSNVSFEKGGLNENPKVDLVVTQCSTIAPDESPEIADLYSSKGIKMISVPILGGIAESWKGFECALRNLILGLIEEPKSNQK